MRFTIACRSLFEYDTFMRLSYLKLLGNLCVLDAHGKVHSYPQGTLLIRECFGCNAISFVIVGNIFFAGILFLLRKPSNRYHADKE